MSDLIRPGLLVVDKPAGCTSHDIVAKVRRTLGLSKVGHAGTLDPSATGVLLVGVSRATRVLQFLQNLPKVYRADVQFGVSTDSQDADGKVTARVQCALERGAVSQGAAQFVGEILQIPPMVSAVKVDGERLYKAARRGEEVDRKPRAVRVHRFDVEEFDPKRQVATVLIKCSSGTYVRTLASDLGDLLGCGAHVASLRRLSIGSFTEDEATPLEALEEMDAGQAWERVLPMHVAMRDFPVRKVFGEELAAVGHGRPLEMQGQTPQRAGELPVLSSRSPGQRPAHEAGMTSGIPVAILGPDGELVAVYRRSSGKLKPAAVLL